MNKLIFFILVTVAFNGCKSASKSDKSFQLKAISKGQSAFHQFFGGEMTVENTKVVNAKEFRNWWSGNAKGLPANICDINFILNGGVTDPSPIALDVTDAMKTKPEGREMFILFPAAVPCKEGTIAGYFATPLECDDEPPATRCNGGIADGMDSTQTCVKTCICYEVCGASDADCTECQ